MAAVQPRCHHTALAAARAARPRRYLLNSYHRQRTRSQSALAALSEATARTACSAALEEHLRSALCVLLPVVLEASRLLSGLADLAATAVQVVAAVRMAQARLVLAARTVETVAPVAEQMQDRQEPDKARQRGISVVQTGRCAAAVAAVAVILLALPEVLAAVVKAAMERQQERQEQPIMAAAVAAAAITERTVIEAALAAPAS